MVAVLVGQISALIRESRFRGRLPTLSKQVYLFERQFFLKVMNLKGTVVYDSIHGNTKQIAEAIAEQLRSDAVDVELFSVKERKNPSGDFLFLGSPTRGSRPTKSSVQFLESLDRSYWSSHPVVLFDTVGPFSKDETKREKWLEVAEKGTKNAAAKLQQLCNECGIRSYPKVLHSAVTGFFGPLAPDATQRAKEFAQQFLESTRTKV